MNKNYALLLLALVCMGARANHKKTNISRNPFAQMDAIMASMRQEMEQMFQAFANRWEEQETNGNTSISIEEESTGDRISIHVSNIQADSINAQVNEDDDVLTIKTNNTTITIYAKDKYLSVELTQFDDQKIETEDKEKTNSIAKSMTHSSFGRMVPYQLSLIDPHPQIDYNPETKMLMIKLNYLKPKKKSGTPLAVNITNNSTK